MVFILVGPKPDKPAYDTSLTGIHLTLKALQDSLNDAEVNNKRIKLNNQARIIWADSLEQQTDWVIVYLHGFSASQMEGDPIHRKIARHFGMNLYLARLSDHGLRSDSALVHMTADRLWETAKKALVIGQKLGKHVILMSTSTGGTLALRLAAEYPERVDALINYSPNVRINSKFAWIMNNAWALPILKLITDQGYVNTSGAGDSLISQYWNTRYRVEALTELEELVETSMQETLFASIVCPSLTIAYYKDEDHQDPTVKVSAMRWMNRLLSTQEARKRFVELPDVGVHPLASGLRSKDLKSVEEQTIRFIEEVLSLKPSL